MLDRNTTQDFHRKLEIGEKGECFILGFLYGKYPKSRIFRALQYSKKFKETYPETFKSRGLRPEYRWNNKELPDFYVANKLFIEVKCKQGFKGKICLSSKHVESYLNIAETTGYDVEVYFILKETKTLYRLTLDNLKNHGRPYTNSFQPNDPFFAWDPDNILILNENIPIDIFETSYR